MKAKDHEETMKTMRGQFRRYAHDAIIAAVDKAKTDLLEPLWADEEPSEDRWTALVDEWDADNRDMLRQWWKDSDVDYYRLDSGLVTSVGTGATSWRPSFGRSPCGSLRSHSASRSTRTISAVVDAQGWAGTSSGPRCPRYDRGAVSLSARPA
jgi:hypothetical protein